MLRMPRARVFDGLWEGSGDVRGELSQLRTVNCMDFVYRNEQSSLIYIETWQEPYRGV